MAIKEYNVDLDIKGKVLASIVPNSTGSIVTWNATTNVFGLRTNAQIISDLNLSSSFITANTTQTGLTGNKTSSGIWTLGQVRKAGQTDSSVLLAGGGHRPVSDFALAGSLGDYVAKSGDTMTGALTIKSSTNPGKDVLLTLGRHSAGYGDTKFSQSYDDRYYGNGKTLDIDLHNNTYLSLAGANNTATGKIIAHKRIEYDGVTSDNWNTAYGWGNHAGLYVPYTGANQPIDLNTQTLRIGGDFNKSFSTFERSHLDPNETGIAHFTRLTDVSSFSRGNDNTTQSDCIVIKFPISGYTRWVMEVDIFSPYSNGIFGDTPTKLIIGAVNTNSVLRSVNAISGANNVKSVSFGRDANNNTVIIIRPSDDYTSFSYGRVNIANFYHSAIYNADLAVKSNYQVEAVLESSLTGLTTNGTITNAKFNRDSYLWNKGDFTQTNVDNWNTAFGWGNFKNQISITDIQDPITAPALFMWGTEPLNSTGLGTNGRGIDFGGSGDRVQRIFVTQTGRMFFQGGNNLTTNLIEVISTSNLDSQATSLGFIKSSALPTVNNGQLTLSTGTGLTGSATFTANQSGSSTFSVAVASTHKLPTTAEWNALPTTNTTYTAGTGLSLTGTTFANTAPNATHTGDVTGATALTIANNAVTHAKYQNIPTQRILGRGATGTGNVQELTLGANLSLSTSGVLSATNTNTTYTGSNGINVSGTVISPNYGTSANTIAQGNDTRINNGQTAFNSLGNYILRTNLNNRSGLLNSVTGGSDFYYSPSNDPNKPTGVTDGAFISMSYDSDKWYTQLYADWRNNEWYVRTKNSGTWGSFQKLIHTGNVSSALSGYVPTSRTVTAGNGLSGGGTLAANRTITLGTPGDITLSSTNSVGTATHTHAFTPGGTTAQYIRGDGSLATMPTLTDAITTISRNGVNIPIVSQNVDIPIFSTSGAGLVPARVGSVATKYLREDGTWVTPTNTNTTYSAGTGLSLTGTVFANTAPNATHTGDVTGATALTIANNAVTHAKYQNIATQRILGRGATGTGNVQELTLGANLSLSTSGVLSSSNTTYVAGTGLNLSGNTFSVKYGTAAGTSAQGNDTRINNGQTAFGWGNHAGLYPSRAGSGGSTNSVLTLDTRSTNPIPSTDLQRGVWFDFKQMTVIGGGTDSGNYGASMTFVPYNDDSGNNHSAFRLTQSSATTADIPQLFVQKYRNGAWYDQYRIWHEGNLSQSSIDNWDTAFGWGDHADAGYALSSQLSSYVPTSRTITINGVTQNLSANRSWTVEDTITRLRGTTSGAFTSGDLTLLAGANTTITQSGSNITIASTNTNTTYSAGTGLSLTGTVFGQTITTSGTGTFVTGITQTTNGFQINLGTPPNTNTTYSAGTLALLQIGTNETNRVWSPKILADYVLEMTPGTSNFLKKNSTNKVTQDFTLEYDFNTPTISPRISSIYNEIDYADNQESLNLRVRDDNGEGFVMSIKNDRVRFYSKEGDSTYIDIDGNKINNLKLRGGGSIGSPLNALTGNNLSSYVLGGDISNKDSLATFRVESNITNDGIPVFGRYGASILAQTGDTMFTISANPNSPDVLVTAGNTTNNVLWNRRLAFSVNPFTITATAFYETSLRKLKENIKPFNKSGVELINSLDIVTFDRIDDKTKNKIGVIANDTSEEFLSEDKDAVDLYKTIFIQAKAIQELNRENKSLEDRLSRLEKLVNKLTSD